MTGATSIFSWDFLSPASQNSTFESSAAEAPASNMPAAGHNISDAFQLAELHQHWFGERPSVTNPDRLSQDTGDHVSNGAERESGNIAYRVLEISSDAVEPDLDALTQRKGIAAVTPENLAETLASAERVMQNLTDLPPHSRLEASLTALEAALAGVSLSDLEAALAVAGSSATRTTGR
jgi:hypothetical protein